MAENDTDGVPLNVPGGFRSSIQQAKVELEQMIDFNPQTMLLTNSDTVVMRANRSLLELLGLENFGGVLGKRLEELFKCDDPQFFQGLLSVEENYVAREANIVLPDGRAHVIQFTTVGFGKDEKSFVVIVHDASEERDTADMIEKTYKKEAVHALMGALMHHLNQPLTVITVRARLISLAIEKGEAKPDEVKRDLQSIMDLAMDMARTLRRVEETKQFATEAYLEGLDILDIDSQE